MPGDATDVWFNGPEKGMQCGQVPIVWTRFLTNLCERDVSRCWQANGIGIMIRATVVGRFRIVTLRIVFVSMAMFMRISQMYMGPGIVMSLVGARRQVMGMRERGQLTGDEAQNHGNGYDRAKHVWFSLRRMLELANSKVGKCFPLQLPSRNLTYRTLTTRLDMCTIVPSAFARATGQLSTQANPDAYAA